MTYILALDQGTTSSRAIVFDDAGAIVGSAQEEFAQHFPRPGWVEHDPLDIWTTQLATARQALEHAKITASDLAGVGIANQRETTVVWDRRTGQPIHRAIVWQDRRTAERCDTLRAAGHEEVVREKTGLVLDAYFSGTKIAWLLDHVDGARDLAQQGHLAFGTVDTWLIYQLTGGAVHVTDPGNASRTLLFNLHTLDWDEDLLKTFDVPRSLLPGVVPSSGGVGTTDPALLGAAVPIAGIAGDQQAALFGQRGTEPGAVKCTYGTGCFLLMNTGDTPQVSNHRLLTTVAWARDGHTAYALEGSVFVGGAVVQWLRDGLKIIETARECDERAAAVPDSDGVILVPAFAGLGAPHWDAYARGMLIGVTRGTTADHICRAALEAIAFQVADLLDAMRADAHLPIDHLRVDGGAAASDLMLQFQADILGMPVVRPQVTETTAMGAAALASLAVGGDGVGVCPNTGPDSRRGPATRGNTSDGGNTSSAVGIDRVFEPTMPSDQAQALRRRWARAVERTRGWAQEA